ncbi:TetR/AcrR family transcriptional regulator [Mycolicibacterium mucogenicum]|uniref:TetR/AcrR family transcriptional regulator n=1 Tax=Mycolicibacterium TaxID=1866885 RepID=UPI002269A331|nr:MULTISPECIES: TetR/AcrR family transcriptional regulator [Mycolicibacterium]MCX8563229.1 TetR/AcrR family transcriptional regulator [Mycolicibacterium mucogenicum]
MTSKAVSKPGYHHGDLRTALVQSALALLEEEGAAALSMRAVARHAGVTAAAPYRHYQDRDALMSAVAAVGYRELAADLVAVSPSPSTADEIADVAIAYVRFALRRPALFRAMFSEQCDAGSPERVEAVAAISAYLRANIVRVFPDADPDALSDAVWALVHGLAFLFLDGKFDSADSGALEHRVRAAVQAVVGLAGS